MDTWIALARGPLFRISLAVCVLGLAYHFGNVLTMIVRSYRQASDKNIPFGATLVATLKWLLPLRLLKANTVIGIASVLFHLGIILVPVFYLGHVGLLQNWLPAGWPTLAGGVADVLTLLAAAAILGLLVGRMISSSARQITSFTDVLLLLSLLGLVLSGYWAAHPSAAPIAPRVLVLLHMLLGDLLLLMTPFSKIVHCVLYPFTQLVAELGWHFPIDSGRRVAVALAKENEAI